MGRAWGTAAEGAAGLIYKHVGCGFCLEVPGSRGEPEPAEAASQPEGLPHQKARGLYSFECCYTLDTLTPRVDSTLTPQHRFDSMAPCDMSQATMSRWIRLLYLNRSFSSC
jgi:hypothetical protein